LLVRRVEAEGWSLAEAAAAAGVSERTAAKWRARYRAEGERGLLDRSSAPRRIPHRTPPERVRSIARLRRLRMTAAEIAEALAMPLSNVCAVLQRIGLGRLSRLAPPEPPNRYERRRAGELLHVDVKKLARIACPGHRVTRPPGVAARADALSPLPQRPHVPAAWARRHARERFGIEADEIDGGHYITLSRPLEQRFQHIGVLLGTAPIG
jgi:transposase